MQQLVQLILQPAHQELIQLLIHFTSGACSNTSHNLDYNHCASNGDNIICRFSILCYWNCNSYSDWYSRRNIHSSSRSIDHSSNRSNKPCYKYTRYLYNYLFFHDWSM